MAWFPVMRFAAPTDGTAIVRDYPLVPVYSGLHEVYGPVEYSADRVRRMVENFAKHLFQTVKGAVVDRDHAPESGSHAFITDVRQGEDGSLLADLELTEEGLRLYAAGTHQFLSPTIKPVYQAPDGQLYFDVLAGASFVPHSWFESNPALSIPTAAFGVGVDQGFMVFSAEVPLPGNDDTDLTAHTASPAPSPPPASAPGSGGGQPHPQPLPAGGEGGSEGELEQQFAAQQAELAELRFAASVGQFGAQFETLSFAAPDGTPQRFSPAWRGESAAICAEVARHDPALAVRVARQLSVAPQALYLTGEQGFSASLPAGPEQSPEYRSYRAQLGLPEEVETR